jgi:DNA primase
LDASGLFGKREDGGFYDKFRGRLMFPIQNETGKVIGFGGRALKDGDEPKYLNSPETKIYKKSNVLYNLHRAKDGIRKGGFTVLVEGYMDVIGVWAAGVRNVVASCGTALTSPQVRTMKRHSPSIVVNFDPDVAGANATEKSLQILLDEGMHVRVLELEGGLDPDEYIKKNSAPVYQQKLSKAAGYFIWLCDRARKNFDMSTSDGRMKGYEAMLLPAIRRISDRLERASVATEVANYLGLDQNLVLAEFRKMAGQRHQGAAPGAEAIPARERIVLRSILCDREVRDILVPRITVSPAARTFFSWRLFDAVCALYTAQPDFSYEQFEQQLDEKQRSVLTTAIFADRSNEVFTPDQAGAFAGQLESEDLRMACKDLEAEIKAAEREKDFEKAFELMRRLEEVKRGLRQAFA